MQIQEVDWNEEEICFFLFQKDYQFNPYTCSIENMRTLSIFFQNSLWAAKNITVFVWFSSFNIHDF